MAGAIELPQTNRSRIWLGYVGMLVAAIVLFMLVRVWGDGLSAPAGGSPAKPDGQAADAGQGMFHLLVALAAVIGLGNLLGRLCIYVWQPPVIGEVVAGICLGPSLLGRVAPAAGDFLLPAQIAPWLAIVAQLGVIVYMFVVGLELNLTQLRQHSHATLAISHASIVVPFSLGALLALWLYPRLSYDDVTFTAFALFLAVSMSITAFPVLARILTDQQLHTSELGVMALVCAAINDLTAWCLLALMVGVARADPALAVKVTLATAVYVGLIYFVARPLVRKFLARFDQDYAASPNTGQRSSTLISATLLVAALASAAVTERIGIHAIFGAFLFGAIVPHESRAARELADKLQGFVTAVLLPAFFALTGLRTQIGLVSGWENWLICLVIIAVATLGKFGGTLAAARVLGMPWRDASSLGILMNTRGLMELVVLNIGLDLGVVSPTLFAMMVLMAIATTVATGPILHWLNPQSLNGSARA